MVEALKTHNDIVIISIIWPFFQEWESNSVTGLVTYFTLQATTTVGTFTNCYIGQLLIDEVYHPSSIKLNFSLI